jgi:hypothetical protein
MLAESASFKSRAIRSKALRNATPLAVLSKMHHAVAVTVRWDGVGSVFLTGPVETTFSGIIADALLKA